MFKYLIGVMTRVGRGDDDSSERNQGHSAQSLISCFLCGWFITGKIINRVNSLTHSRHEQIELLSGCVWVYRIYKPLMEEEYREEPNYCNKTVYIFAFWLITTAYIFLGLFTSCICCFSIVSVILKREY